MGNCAEICRTETNNEQLLSLNIMKNIQSKEKALDWSISYSYNTLNTNNTIISNTLININKKPSFGKNNKLKSQKVILEKVDSNDKIKELNGINDDDSFIYETRKKNENNLNNSDFDERKSKNKIKNNFQGPIFSHLLKHSKNRNIIF